ncbi:MAG: DUF507 family protein [bacterium]
MKLYRSKIEPLAKDILGTLNAARDIEVAPDRVAEAELDVRAILDQYVRVDSEVLDRAKDLVQQRNLPQTELGRVRRIVAEERKHKVGDDGVDWLIDQIIEGFMVSANVDEVFADDPTLRRHIHDVMRKHLEEDNAIDVEVRGRLKHLQEGTQAWEIEYQRVLQEVRKKRGAA